MDAPPSRVVYRFSGFELDAVAYELMRDGARIRLARQPMDLLLLLVRRAGELVSRDEIARHLWPRGRVRRG
jgi:non-specific serine/threonine protein kinase